MPTSNPVLIQDTPHTRNLHPPLFLIHDASGLVNSYFRLGPLSHNRRIYGIWDPKFDINNNNNQQNDTTTHWASVDAMATHYIRLIRKVCPRGPILLGGWSFGGIIAVHTAHTLASRPGMARGLRCTGIVLIDSVYPRCTRPEARKAGPNERHAPDLPGVSDETRERLLHALARATAISDNWNPPVWAKRADGETTPTLQERAAKPTPPPVVLIRAPEFTPVVEKSEVCPLDRTRFLPMLGWEDMQEGFVSCVLETPGNHYTVFDGENIPSITNNIKTALDLCDGGVGF